MRLPLLAPLVLLLAGCVDPGVTACACTQPQPPACAADCAEAGEGLPFDAPAPDLPVGRAFTYADAYVYDSEAEITVVVAEASEAGYLLAGAAEDDVVSAAVWGRAWFGRVDRDLSPEGGPRLFAFPLVDGKSWEMREGLTVTARAAEVETPAGPEPGFVVEGRDEAGLVRLQYAPSVGYFTEWLREADGRPFLHLRLKAVGSSSTFVSWEPGPAAWAQSGTDAPAAPLDVPAGFDAVLASAGGAGGGRAVVAPPGPGAADAWAAEFAGEEDWLTRVYPAEPGAWTLAAASPPEGFGYARAVAVKWVRGQISP